MVEKKGFCALCRSRCGTVNIVENERLIEVRPDRSHPTGQAICPKGRAGPEIAHNARRLTQPMRRTNPKGSKDPGFVPMTWDDALDEIASRMLALKEKYGAESVAFGQTSSSSSAISDSADWIQRLFRLFGSPNNCMAAELCNWHKDYAHAFTYGVGLPSPDYRNSDLIVLWGHNPANSWLAQAQAIGDAKSRGARVVAIDPKRGGSARDADHWIGIRPGSDGALALGVANLLIEHGHYDANFIRKWSNGPFLVRNDNGLFLRGADVGGSIASDSYLVWNETTGAIEAATAENASSTALFGTFSAEARQGQIGCRPAFDHYAAACRPFTPERVSELTYTSQEDVRLMADAFSKAKRVSYYGWIGIAQHANATQTDRAIALLHALTGCFDQAGGNIPFAAQPTNSINDMSLMEDGQRRKALGLDRRPIGPPNLGWITSHDLYDAIIDKKPYQVRAYIGFGKNLLVSHPNPDRGREALTKLEFQVHCDLTMNPTAHYADILLPVNTLWEREALRVGFEITAEAQELIQLRQQMIPSLGESRSDMAIVFDLAVRLGLADKFFDGDIDRALNHQLAPTGITVQDLRDSPEGIRRALPRAERRYETAGFKTQTKRLEIYSELFQAHGYRPVPDFVSPEETTEEFPFVLNTANSGYFCHSQHRNINALRRKSTEPGVSLNSSTAKAIGAGAGDLLELTTRYGRARMRARIDDSMHPQVLSADYGWWEACPDLGLPGYDAGQGGANYNVMIGEGFVDPISAAPALRSHVCNVAPVSSAAWDGYKQLRITDHIVEADDVVTIKFGNLDGELLQPFRAGQNLSLRLDGVSRSYSLTGPASENPKTYSVSIKRHEHGAFSRIVADHLKIGDVVEAKVPSGSFLPLPGIEFPVVFIAAGIGITPFISFLESMKGTPSEPPVVLHYVTRSYSSTAFASRLSQLAARLPNFRCFHYFTKPGAGDPPHRSGRLSADAVTDAEIAARARVYMCGPDEMMKQISSDLIRRGARPFEIFRERFQAAASATAMGFATFDLYFKRSDRHIRWTPEAGTILSCAEQAGLTVPSGCRVGQCESCALTVVNGGIQHLAELEGAEDGVCLTCQAVPTSDVVFDW